MHSFPSLPPSPCVASAPSACLPTLGNGVDRHSPKASINRGPVSRERRSRAHAHASRPPSPPAAIAVCGLPMLYRQINTDAEVLGPRRSGAAIDQAFNAWSRYLLSRANARRT
jgi:hypothetical protein